MFRYLSFHHEQLYVDEQVTKSKINSNNFTNHLSYRSRTIENERVVLTVMGFRKTPVRFDKSIKIYLWRLQKQLLLNITATLVFANTRQPILIAYLTINGRVYIPI